MPHSPVASTEPPYLDYTLAISMVLGIVFLFWQSYRRSDRPWERVLFDVGCQTLILWQLGSMILLFGGLYNVLTQFILLSSPWILSIWTIRYQSIQAREWSISTVNGALYGLLFLTIVGYAWLASPPPWMRDSLTYHLALAKQYAMHGQYVKTDLVIFGLFPQGWQSILTLFHTPVDGTSLFNPRYINVCISACIAMGIIGFLKSLRCNTKVAISAGLIYLWTPTIIEFGTSCYVQPWLTMAALYLAIALQERQPLWKIGILTGLLCSLKYSALIVPCILSTLLLFKYNKSLHKTLPFFLGLLLIGGPFYIRNMILTGNPTFPLLYSIFGGEGWDTWRAMAYDITLKNYGSGRTVIDFILIPWRILTTRDMIGSFQGSLGPIWALLTIYAVQRKEWLRWLSLAWFVFWCFQVQQIRFLVPILPWILILSIPNLSGTIQKWWGLGLCIAFGWGFSLTTELHNNQKTSVYWSNRLNDSETADEIFLKYRLPENFPVYQHLNQLNTTKVWLVWMRGYNYYLDSDTRIDNVFGGYRFEQLLFENTPIEVLTSLRQDNISHISINWRFFLHQDNADRIADGATIKIQQRFNEMIQKRYLIPIHQWGPVWIYDVSDSDSDSRSSSILEE